MTKIYSKVGRFVGILQVLLGELNVLWQSRTNRGFYSDHDRLGTIGLRIKTSQPVI